MTPIRDSEGMTNTAKVWVRYESVEKAVAAAGRLSAKYGVGRFAVASDPWMKGDTHPFVVVSHPTTSSAR